VPGLILTIVIAASVLYTSLIVWYVLFIFKNDLCRC
jgi:hypothetical protein